MEKERVVEAIIRISDYIDKLETKGSLNRTYKRESTYQTKLLNTFKQLKLKDVMWWAKISDRYNKGIPDIICCIGGKFVYFELKVEGNTASQLQKYNMELIKNAGGVGCIAIDLEKPLQTIKSILRTYAMQL